MGLFGGSDSSSATSTAQSSINSSGWVVGSGSASGGTLNASTGNGATLPKYAVFSIAAVVVAFVYYRNKRGK